MNGVVSRKSIVLFVLSVAALATACGPTRGGGVPDEVRRQYEVTIFTDDPETGRRVLAAIEELGYTHPENEVLDTPNDEFNIKWGGAPDEVVDEIRALVEPVVHQELFPRHLFGPEDHDVFINLPVCALGGAFKPDTCGQPVAVSPDGWDPQLNAQGVPTACGFPGDSPSFGAIGVGTEVVLGRHSEWSGDANWVEDMDAYVGKTARVTELYGTDGSGCLVVHLDIDNGAWFWRVRDMKIVGGALDSPAAVVPDRLPGGPDACGMTDETVSYGAVQVGTRVTLGRHRVWEGEDNWAEDMEAFVGQKATVTSLEGTDGSGCAIVKVDTDKGEWYWRVRDLGVEGGAPVGPAPQSATGFPQKCGMTGATADYGQAQLGASVRLGRHREVGGDANWAEDMEPFVGRTGRVTELVGVDAAGCPVVHVDADSGEWAWRVRDLMAP